MHDDIHLYSIAVCPFAQRSRILLGLKGVAFGLTEIDITRPRPDWFLEINPLGQVPVLRYRGEVLNESSVINEFLDEVIPSPRVLPFRAMDRARTRILVDRLNGSFVPSMYGLLMNQDPARHAELLDKALRDWRWLDEFLRRFGGEGPWLGEEFGMAELSAAPFFQRYCLNAHYRGFVLPDTADFDRVRQWRDAMLAHPLVIETGMPDEDYLKLYEDYALGQGNGAVPPGRARSSFDPAVPLADRPLPAPPDWVLRRAWPGAEPPPPPPPLELPPVRAEAPFEPAPQPDPPALAEVDAGWLPEDGATAR